MTAAILQSSRARLAASGPGFLDLGVDQKLWAPFGPLDYKEHTIIQTPKGPIILINPHFEFSGEVCLAHSICCIAENLTLTRISKPSTRNPSRRRACGCHIGTCVERCLRRRHQGQKGAEDDRIEELKQEPFNFKALWNVRLWRLGFGVHL